MLVPCLPPLSHGSLLQSHWPLFYSSHVPRGCLTLRSLQFSSLLLVRRSLSKADFPSLVRSQLSKSWERFFPNYPIQSALVNLGSPPAPSLFSLNIYKSMHVLVCLYIYLLPLAYKLQKSRFPVCHVCAVSPVPRTISGTYRRLVLIAWRNKQKTVVSDSGSKNSPPKD